MDMEDRPGRQAPLQKAGVEGVQMARGEALEWYPADGRDEVNLNLGFMLRPGARPHLRPQTR
jgi:hypothetical protein